MAIALLAIGLVVGLVSAVGVGVLTGSWLLAFLAYGVGGTFFLVAILVGAVATEMRAGREPGNPARSRRPNTA